MPKIMYKDTNFKGDSLEKIDLVNDIIDEYNDQGYELTLRQVYYQLVARGYIENSERSYKNLGNLINDGRLAGLIDWTSIVDRTRNVKQNAHWSSPDQIISVAADSYFIDTREDQDVYVEVWVEKDALVGIVGGVCAELDIPFFSCRGYTSSSEMWVSAQRIIEAGSDRCAKSIILHLGDHDPSGIDMTRDIKDRMGMFEAYVDVIRIGLTMEQIDLYNPPPNPTKLSDSRATKYIEEHGYSCWELDALEPRVIEELIRTFVREYTDPMKIHKKLRRLDKEKEELKLLTEGYAEAISFLKEESQR